MKSEKEENGIHLTLDIFDTFFELINENDRIMVFAAASLTILNGLIIIIFLFLLYEAK